MKLAGVVGPLRTQVVYLIMVLVFVLQEPVHLVYVVSVDSFQLLRREPHRYQPVCDIWTSFIKENFALYNYDSKIKMKLIGWP